MATCHFDGVDDEIRGTGNGAMSGDLSIFVILRLEDTGSVNQGFVSFYASGGGYTCEFFYVNPGNIIAFDTGVSTTGPTTVSDTSGHWYILGVTKTSGTTNPRFHQRNLTTGSAWVHENGGTAIASPASASGGSVQLGNWGSTVGTLSEDFKGDFALAAWWDGTVLSDAHVESLVGAYETSDWHSLAQSKPSSLTELDNLTPVDLEGLVTWSTITVSGLTGPDPESWTFDGTGSTGTKNYSRFPKVKLRRR